MTRNWFYQLLALLLAFLTWYLVSGREKVDTWVEIPVEYVKIPKNMTITSGLVNRIQVRIRGSQGLVRGDNVQRLTYIADLSSLKTGLNVIILDPNNIPRFSKALEIIELDPSRLELRVDILDAKTVPVEVRWEGISEEDFSSIQTRCTPDRILIKGPLGILQNISEIRTEEITFNEEHPSVWEGVVGLIIPSRVETSVGEVQARLEFVPKKQPLWVKRPVEAMAPPGYVMEFDPQYVRVQVDLPLYRLREEDWRERIHVGLRPSARLGAGEHTVSYRVTLPDDMVLLETRPTEIRVILADQNESRKESASGQAGN